MSHTPSPGNQFTPEVPPMRLPHLEHEYRLIADMAGENMIKNIHGSGLSRDVLYIAGGIVKGPRVNGVVVPNSGADWATKVESKKPFYRLDARYTVQTDDGHYILVNAKGSFSLGPDVPDTGRDEPTYSQDEVEYFSHLTYEAPGDSPYNWMNGIVTVGVMTMWENKVVIDAYRLTNFPGKEVESIYVGKENKASL